MRNFDNDYWREPFELPGFCEPFGITPLLTAIQTQDAEAERYALRRFCLAWVLNDYVNNLPRNRKVVLTSLEAADLSQIHTWARQLSKGFGLAINVRKTALEVQRPGLVGVMVPNYISFTDSVGVKPPGTIVIREAAFRRLARGLLSEDPLQMGYTLETSAGGITQLLDLKGLPICQVSGTAEYLRAYMEV